MVAVNSMKSPHFIDFHAHLDDQNFATGRAQLIDHCFQNGLKKIVTVIDPFEKNSIETSAELLDAYPGIWAVAGAHPHAAERYTPFIENSILEILKQNKVWGIGEIGLDFHYNYSSAEKQVATFRRQLALAKELKKPVIIHSRKAESEILKILAGEKMDSPVVFHCYSGSLQESREILARGYYLSFSGIITFKNAGMLGEVVRLTPLERLFSETDSPYLAPEPHRGKINIPAYVQLVAEKMAAIKEISLYQLTEAIENNLEMLIIASGTRSL